ncbi:MAG: CHAT domain-containing protein [Bacteroidota bacterium]
MSLKPVIFISFANDKDEYLLNLQKEEDNIYGALQHAHDAGFIEIYNRGRATLDDIFTQFTRYRDRVVIFHYGGHANGSTLRLEDHDADSSGLAQLMGQQQNLKLVFLNGCSTQGQVQTLLNYGVKAVIATSVPIQDDKAVAFSTQFYKSLAAKATIKHAFEEAVSRLVAENEVAADTIKVHRDIMFDWEAKDGAPAEMPWGLYVKDESALSWKLPTVDKSVFSDPWVGTKIESQEVNKHIVLPVFEAMAEYNEAFAEQLGFYRISKNPAMLDMLFRQMMDLIIKHFPWPIGIKLRTLFSSDDGMIRKSKGRLQAIISTYVRLSRFLLYVLFSQLWDELEADNDGKVKFKIKEGYKEDFEDFFNLNPASRKSYDYMRMMGRLVRIFDENSIKPFIDQFEGIYKSVEAQDEFYKAYIYLEGIRGQFAKNEISDAEIGEICDKCEFSLGTLLKKCSFLVTYQLISIKDIGISNPRRQDPKFKHQMGVLAGVAIEVMEGTPKDYLDFTDSHSVLLVKRIDEVKENLNLTPFIIDENAFKSINAPKIYMYAFNVDFDSFFYTHVDNDGANPVPEMMTTEEKYPYLKELFLLFKSELTAALT